jgi:FixJ family two-component response regulator
LSALPELCYCSAELVAFLTPYVSAARSATNQKQDLSGMETLPTVVVIEDDAYSPDSVAGALAGLPVLFERFSSSREALDYCTPQMHGCLVLDQAARDTDVFYLRRRLVAQGCRQPFIFISRSGDVASAVEAMHQGALDCIPRPLDERRLLAGVQKAIAEDAAGCSLRAERASVAARTESLTPREMQVLELVAAGKMTKEIARRLAISPKTVEAHRSNTMKKMQVGSAAELFHLIAMHAIVSFPALPVGQDPLERGLSDVLRVASSPV